MVRRSTRTTGESPPEGRVETAPSQPINNVTPPEERIPQPANPQPENDFRAEMLALLRQLIPPQLPAPANPQAQDIDPPQQAPQTRNHDEELSDAVSSAQHNGRSHGRANRDRPEERLLPPQEGRFMRDEIREVLAQEYGQYARYGVAPRQPHHHGSPLDPQVLAHPIPHGFKLPHLETFDGTEDPFEHINHFVTIMRICNAPDQLLCQVFPATLKGQARIWFHSLPDGTLRNFTELAQQFTEQFAANRRIVRDPSHLSGIRQSEGETLKEYFRRFTAEARQIPGVNSELLRGVFLGGLRPSGFYSALMRETVRTYPDLVHRIEAQIAADEAIEAHRQQFENGNKRRRGQEQPERRREEPRQGDRRDNNRRQDRPRERDPLPPRVYTPLNTSRTNVLYAIQNDPALQRPRPQPPNPRNDQSKYCEFHRSTGHTTEECAALKNEIERLIRQGLLGRFLQGQVQGQQAPQRQARECQNVNLGGTGERQVVGNIETIAGSPALMAQVLSIQAEHPEPQSKDPYLKAAITFGDEELEKLQSSHQNPLVISAKIGNPCYNVKRILIDNGSSVDILFLSTLQSMKLSQQDLHPVSGSVYGFDNHPVPVQGTITLPVTMGEFPKQATHSIQFVVVDSPSAYNAIFGRPLQIAFGAIPSIPHLTIKFPTTAGIGEVRGNPEEARTCSSKQSAPAPITAFNISNLDPRTKAAIAGGNA